MESVALSGQLSAAFDALSKELNRYVAVVEPRKEEREVRSWILCRLRDEVSTLFGPDVETVVFGSFYTGVYLFSGDIDLIVIDASLTTHQILLTLTKHLRTLNWLVDRQSVNFVNKARVPVLKFTTKVGLVDVDVSANHSDGIDSTKLVYKWTKQYRHFEAVSMVVKEWLKAGRFNQVKDGGLGGYALSCMIVALLRLFSSISNQHDALARLVYLFFETYGCSWRYSLHAVDVRDGCVGHSPIPTVFIRENEKYARGLETRVYIVDPNNVQNNVSKGSYRMGEIKAAMQHVHTRMRTALQSYTAASGGSLMGGVGVLSQKVEDHRDRICLDWLVARDSWQQQSTTRSLKQSQLDNSLRQDRYFHDDSSDDDDFYFSE